jgi:lysophospholipase L1-like esterase
VALALLLPAGVLRADPITVAALGDSLTDTYIGKPYSGTNRNWVDQLQASRSGGITISNLALAGSTSSDLLSQGQDTRAANLAGQGRAQYATVMIGANDLGAFLQGVTTGGTTDPTATISRLVSNVNTALSTLQAAGLKVVLSNVPDITTPPYYHQLLAGQPQLMQLMTGATQAVNAQLAMLARARGIPVVDLYRLNNISPGQVMLGNTDVTMHLYGPDGFHPSTVGQGLLADTILDAMRIGYGADTRPLLLMNHDILTAAGLPDQGGPAFDTSVFVQQAPEPSTLALLGVGAAGLLWARRKRLRAA